MKLDRKTIRKMILKEMSDLPGSTYSGSNNRVLAVEMLKNVISDLQNVPEENLNKYCQYLINFKIPNIIRTLED